MANKPTDYKMFGELLQHNMQVVPNLINACHDPSYSCVIRNIQRQFVLTLDKFASVLEHHTTCATLNIFLLFLISNQIINGFLTRRSHCDRNSAAYSSSTSRNLHAIRGWLMWRSQPTAGNADDSHSPQLHASVLTAKGRHTMNQRNTVESWIRSKFHLIQFLVYEFLWFFFGRCRYWNCCVQIECDWIGTYIRWKWERRMRKALRIALDCLVCARWSTSYNLLQAIVLHRLRAMSATLKWDFWIWFIPCTFHISINCSRRINFVRCEFIRLAPKIHPLIQPYDERCHLRWNILEKRSTGGDRTHTIRKLVLK